MLCSIADRPQGAKSVTWPQLRANSASAQGVFSPAQAPTVEVADLQQRIAELEAALKNQVAQTGQTAFDEGLKQGREEGTVAMKAASERLAQTLAELVSFKRKLRAEAEMEVVKLSLAVARRILHRELLTDPEAMQGLVHAALQKIQGREVWRVRVSPIGVEAVRAGLERAGLGAIEIIAEASFKSGDLVIETALGDLDASVDTQLQEIQRGFADRLVLR